MVSLLLSPSVFEVNLDFVYLLQEHGNVAVPKDVFPEVLLVQLFEDQLASHVLLEQRLHEKHPHLFDADHRISKFCVEFDQKVKDFLIRVCMLVKGHHGFIIFSVIRPKLLSKIFSDYFIARIHH